MIEFMLTIKRKKKECFFLDMNFQNVMYSDAYENVFSQ